MAISILSCSYCICNRYCQNHSSIIPNFLLFAWFDTLEFNGLPCSNNKIYRWCGFRWSIPLSVGSVWNSSIDIAILTTSCLYCIYITDGAKIIAAFCRIFHCLHDLIRLNSIVGNVQTTRCTMTWFSTIDSDINWLCLKSVYSRSYLDSLILILHMK